MPVEDLRTFLAGGFRPFWTRVAGAGDREPVGQYRLLVPARRTRHFRFNDLRDPEPIPKGTDYSSVITSDVPVVVQYTRLDTRQVESALFSTIPFTSAA